MDILVREDVAGEFMNLLRPGVSEAVGAELAESFAGRPRDAWLDVLADAGIPAAPVASREEWLAARKLPPRSATKPSTVSSRNRLSEQGTAK